jgi:hypothetical protein
LYASVVHVLENILQAAEALHRKQDGLINAAEQEEATAEGGGWKGRPKGIVDLQIHWVLEHNNFAPNEKADEEARKKTCLRRLE